MATIEVPEFEGFEAFYGDPTSEKNVWILNDDGNDIQMFCGFDRGVQICYRKIQPKRIVLEQVLPVDGKIEYCDFVKDRRGYYLPFKEALWKTSFEDFTYWREVKE